MVDLLVTSQLFMTYQQLTEKYKSVKPHFHVNKMKLPLNVLPQTEEGVNQFNEIIELIHSCTNEKTVLTKSKGIAQGQGWDYQNTYAIIVSKTMIEVLFLWKDYFRFQFRRAFREEKDEMSGSRSFYAFNKICEKYGIDLTEYMTTSEQGYATKETIPSPMIDADEDILNMTLSNVHHIDIHSAHMAGVAEAFPALKAPINECYIRRKENTVYKSIMTHTWGYMQSEYGPVYYRLSHLSKAGIESTNYKIGKLTERLEQSGRIVLAHNTDGIWYSGDIYHGDCEGKELGQWSNDHINCTIRFKSKGVYEYIEDGKYTVVARGLYELDKIKPRSQWTWGSIYYTGKCYKFNYDETTEKLSMAGEYDE